jgi:hypothetical protein
MIIMPTRNTELPKKAKTTVYMTEEEETLLNELLIKRLRERRKTDKSAKSLRTGIPYFS